MACNKLVAIFLNVVRQISRGYVRNRYLCHIFFVITWIRRVVSNIRRRSFSLALEVEEG
jgi:hypothetical protein